MNRKRLLMLSLTAILLCSAIVGGCTAEEPMETQPTTQTEKFMWNMQVAHGPTGYQTIEEQAFCDRVMVWRWMNGTE